VQRLALELSTSLLARAEQCADLLVALRRRVVQPVVTLQYVPVAFGREPQHLAEQTELGGRDCVLRRIDGVLVG